MLMHGFLFSEQKNSEKLLKYQHSLSAPILTLERYLSPKESHSCCWPLIGLKLPYHKTMNIILLCEGGKVDSKCQI